LKKFSFFSMSADETEVDVYINGEIIDNDLQSLYDYFGYDASSPSKFKAQLSEHSGKPLTLHINSRGGDPFAGMAMYHAILDHKGKTTAVVDGLCASAATLPLVGCETVKMTAASLIMIHNASMGFTCGTAQDLKKDIKTLEAIDSAAANAYELKTGLSHDELLRMMDRTTWMDCKSARNYGFCDEIYGNFNVDDNAITSLLNAQKQVVACYYNNSRQNIPDNREMPLKDEIKAKNEQYKQQILTKLKFMGLDLYK